MESPASHLALVILDSLLRRLVVPLALLSGMWGGGGGGDRHTLDLAETELFFSRVGNQGGDCLHNDRVFHVSWCISNCR